MAIVSVADAPDVVAVIPTMGGNAERVRRCIDSVAASAGDRRLAILCVLNSSTADPASVAHPSAAVEVAGVNLGWAGGMLLGAALCLEAQLLWFVQDDMLVEPETLHALIGRLMANPALGMVGPIVLADGLVPVGSCGGVISDTGEILGWYPTVACTPEDLDGGPALSYLPSRGMLVRQDAFRAAGGPDPRLYPVQFVDVDFSYRMRAAGYYFDVEPRARVTHEGWGSSSLDYVEFLQSRNAEYFAKTWYPDSPPPADRHFPVHEHRPDPVSRSRHELHPAIPRELEDAVAQSAADTLTHLGRVFGAALDTYREQLAVAQRDTLELAQLRTSTSWRVTAPMRAMADRFRKR